MVAAIEQLGYRPNAAARALATGRSRTLGVVTLNTTSSARCPPFTPSSKRPRSAGYFLSVVTVQSIDRDSVRNAVGRVADQHVEGLVVIAPLTSTAEALDDLPTDMPVVVVEGDPSVDLAAVTVDQAAGARAATTFLLSCGHQTVFHVAGPSEWQESQGAPPVGFQPWKRQARK